MKGLIRAAIGLVAGFINGLLGAGGGTVVVPGLEKMGVEAKRSHATAIAVILPLTLVSVFFYLKSGSINLKATLIVAASGMAGGFLGAKLMGKIPDKALKIGFAVAVLVMAVRMLFA